MKKALLIPLLGIGILSASCSNQKVPPIQSIEIAKDQNWTFKSGQQVGSAKVISSLGEIAIETKNNKVIAPYNGIVFKDRNGWIGYKTPEIPTHIIKITGIENPKLGSIKRGEKIGDGKIVNVALLQEQSTRDFAYVEITDKSLLNKMFP